MRRALVLEKETVSELTTTELAGIAGGNTNLCVARLRLLVLPHLSDRDAAGLRVAARLTNGARARDSLVW